MHKLNLCTVRKILDVLSSARHPNNLQTMLNSNNLGEIVRNTQNLSWEFSHTVKRSQSVMDQKKTGRCWIFAGMNCLRHEICTDLNMDDFEFSAAYVQFFDKLEKANNFLNIIEKLASHDLDGAYMRHVLADDNLCQDGGTWNMFVQLVKKYGIVPKYAMEDTFQACNTWQMNSLLRKVLKKAVKDIRAHATHSNRS